MKTWPGSRFKDSRRRAEFWIRTDHLVCQTEGSKWTIKTTKILNTGHLTSRSVHVESVEDQTKDQKLDQDQVLLRSVEDHRSDVALNY